LEQTLLRKRAAERKKALLRAFGNPYRKLLALVALVVIAVCLFHVLSPREPRWQGKSVGVWLEEYYPQARYGARNYRGLGGEDVTKQALQAVGEKAIPALLRMLQAQDFPLKMECVNRLEKQDLVHVPYTLAETYHRRAIMGFEILGPRAKGALPELTRLFHQTNWTEVATEALRGIGADSLPIFRAGLSNRHEVIRAMSAAALGSYGSNAVADLPRLLPFLNDSNARVRGSTAVALGSIGQEVDKVLPALIERLGDSDHDVRLWALYGIGLFGHHATSALPAITRAMTNTPPSDRDFLRVATNALKRIEAKKVN